MNNIKFILILFLIIGCSAQIEQPLVHAHAHNDYEHDLPLKDALENRFISVEADVHLIKNNLYVTHDKPENLDSIETLENLYLKPLQQRVKANQGSVYKGYEGFFYLMIDIKTEASPAYAKLKKILIDYEEMISKVVNDKEDKNKPVKIVITGHKGRPYDQILADEPKWVSLDGRYHELGKNISAAVMPYISENYNHYLSYKGVNDLPSQEDKTKLSQMVESVHKEGKKLRFWASPDNKAVWAFLLDHDVDLVNTDSLSKFNAYMAERNKLK